MGQEINRYNFNKIFYHKERLLTFLKSGNSTPIHLTIGFTGYCNHRCLWCTAEYVHSKKLKIEIDPKVLLKFLKEAYDNGLKSLTIVGSGEPLLHPNAGYLIEEISKLGLKIGLFTNGVYINRYYPEILKNLTFIRVSFDAATKETHYNLHRGQKSDFDNIINNLKYLVKNRKEKRPTLGLQFVTGQHNINEALLAVKLAKEIGIDYIAYKPMMKNPLNPSHDKNILQLDDNLRKILSDIKRYETEDFQVYVKVEQFKEVLTKIWNNALDYPICLGHNFNGYIDSDGTFYICTEKAGNLDFSFGSIYNLSFEEMWYGEKRKKIIQSIDLKKCRAACREDPINKILYGLTEEEVEKKTNEIGNPTPDIHPDFI
jgi:radical SAM protein with 4Fe4S-binding SPASM domain